MQPRPRGAVERVAPSAGAALLPVEAADELMDAGLPAEALLLQLLAAPAPPPVKR